MDITITTDTTPEGFKRVGKIKWNMGGKQYDIWLESPRFNSLPPNWNQWDMEIRQGLINAMHASVQNHYLGKSLDESGMSGTNDIRGVFIDGKFVRSFPTKNTVDQSGGIVVEPNPDYHSVADFVKIKGL